MSSMFLNLLKTSCNLENDLKILIVVSSSMNLIMFLGPKLKEDGWYC